jgi:hypothetical protein
LKARPGKPGNYREPIRIDPGDGPNIEIPARLTVSAALAESHPEVKPGRSPSASPPTVDMQQVRRESLRILRIEQSGDRIEIFWRKPVVEVLKYRFEWLEISSQSSMDLREAPVLDAGTEKFSPEEFARDRIRIGNILRRSASEESIVKIWHPLHAVEVSAVSEGIMKAVFPSPQGRHALRIRITSVLADGSDSPVRTEIRIPLEPPARSSNAWFWWVGVALLGLALPLLAFTWLRKVKIRI